MTIQSQVTFDEWALDVTCAPALAFVPICGDQVVFGITMIRDRSPGPLVAVVSENGIDHAREWVLNHPSWKVDFSNAADITQ